MLSGVSHGVLQGSHALLVGFVRICSLLGVPFVLVVFCLFFFTLSSFPFVGDGKHMGGKYLH